MLIMDARPHCGGNGESGLPGKPARMEVYYREICPGRYQCLICGNIQDHSGPCAHCGMQLNGSAGGRERGGG
jgi:hypothetical protein